jgi:hypothetical protein
MIAPRKFISEFGLHVCSDMTVLLQQDQLSGLTGLPSSPHIYIVGRRPRISFDPRSIQIGEEEITGVAIKHLQDERLEIPFVAANELGRTDLSVHSEYPFTEIAFKTPEGEVISNGKTALLLASFNPKHWEHLDLEVLYVGQSYGNDGDRNAIARLQSHSTLQGIYSEAIRTSPDQEIWLILLSFERYFIASFDGITKSYQTTSEEDDVHREHVIQNQITEQQEVNFTEAALIKYFRPPFNVKYKETFPSPGHSTYEQCYNVDLNAVSVEVQTEEIMLRLWSAAVEPKLVHIATFPLHNEEERRYMFELDEKA